MKYDDVKYADLKFKKDKIACIRERVGTSQTWALKALTRIFEMQTAEEQATEDTREHNGVGFTGVDAEILSSFAKQVLKGRNMSPKQMAIIYKKMPKYAKQLVMLAEEEKIKVWNTLKNGVPTNHVGA
jgi:hypothetical protein